MLTQHDDGSITLSEDRATLCLEVAWELEALALVLPGMVPEDAKQSAHAVVRGMAGRIKQLTSVLMSGLSDSVEDVDGLSSTVMVTHKKATP